jgi:PKD repeat protein
MNITRNIATLCSCLFFSQLVYAQNEASNWAFGSHAGLHFSGSNVSTFSSALFAGEGSATVSDANGNLLFYTDGDSVWNAAHAMMPNGFGLLGQLSSSQAAIILKRPASDSIYYIFTTGENGDAVGFNYSIVDMSLAGGLGDVTVKNVLLVTPVSEKVTAYTKSDTANLWVVTHGSNNANFYAYLLTDTGVVTTPVISTVGQSHGPGDAIGWMKISPCGNKLAAALGYSNLFQLFDFNPATGIVSNAIDLPVENATYGVEFSPDANLLYGSEFNLRINQYDLNAPNVAASQVLVGNASPGLETAALQMAPDGKIYVATNYTSLLGVINFPNILGTGCNYSPTGIDLSPNIVWEGLPNFSPHLFAISSCGQQLSAALDAPVTDVCVDSCIAFVNASTNATSYEWFFPGGTPSFSTDLVPPVVCYETPGTYDVTLVAHNGSSSDTAVSAGLVHVYAVPAPTIMLSNDTLFATPPCACAYQWYLNGTALSGEVANFYPLAQSGTYSVEVTTEQGCMGSATTDFINGVDAVATHELQVYPNPADYSFTIKTGSNEARVRLTNALSQPVYNDLVSRTKTVDTSDLPVGIYFLTVETRETNNVIKLLVMHR